MLTAVYLADKTLLEIKMGRDKVSRLARVFLSIQLSSIAFLIWHCKMANLNNINSMKKLSVYNVKLFSYIPGGPKVWLQFFHYPLFIIVTLFFGPPCLPFYYDGYLDPYSKCAIYTHY